MATDNQEFPWKASFWAPDHVAPANSLGQQDIDVDLAVIGGGYAGMSCAYYVKKARPDLSVAVLESDYIGFGPSGRNFGAVAPGVRELRAGILDLPNAEEDRFAVQWYLGQRAELERRIAEGGIECEYRDEPLMMQALDESAWEALQRESDVLTARGTPHLLLDTAALEKDMALPYRPLGGIVRTAWRAVQPFKLARGFGQQLRDMGVAVHEGTRVADFSDSGDAVLLRTEDGAAITARKAVLATNAYTHHLPKVADLIAPRHTYVIATEVLDDARFASLGFGTYKFVEDAGFIFYYSRVYNGRLLFGGGELTTGFFTPSTVDHEADTKLVEYQRLYDEMVRRWPQLAGVKVDAAWSGPVDATENFAPVIRTLDDMPNVTACVGFNGEGLMSGSVAGLLAIGQILGPEYADPDAERVRRYLLQPID
jgi:gamma-glutamylputrescine oxidase